MRAALTTMTALLFTSSLTCLKDGGGEERLGLQAVPHFPRLLPTCTVFSILTKLVNSNVGLESSLTVSVASRPATGPAKQTTEKVVEHKQEMPYTESKYQLYSLIPTEEEGRPHLLALSHSRGFPLKCGTQWTAGQELKVLLIYHPGPWLPTHPPLADFLCKAHRRRFRGKKASDS